MLLLSEAQTRVEEHTKGAKWALYGVNVKYAPRCQCTFIVTVNDWRGKEVFFVMGKRQFANTKRLEGELLTAHNRLKTKR